MVETNIGVKTCQKLESGEILVCFSQIRTLFYVEFFNQKSNDKGKDFLDS